MLVIVVLVLGVFFGWLGSRLQRARRDRQAVAEVERVKAEIERLGGHFSYGFAEESPSLLEKLLGDPRIFEVYKVVIQSRVGDAGLENLKSLPRVGKLNLSFSQVTDAGLVHLEGLTVESVDLTQTKVTDAGLEHLKKLNGLQSVKLKGARVTGEGVSSLKDALPDLSITPSPDTLIIRDEIRNMGGDTFFTRPHVYLDEGVLAVDLRSTPDSKTINAVLTYLAGLTNFKELIDLALWDSKVTDADLERVKGLTKLRRLYLDGSTQVAQAEIWWPNPYGVA